MGLGQALAGDVALPGVAPSGVAPDGTEPPNVTSGTALAWVAPLVAQAGLDYSAADVVAWLLG